MLRIIQQIGSFSVGGVVFVVAFLVFAQTQIFAAGRHQCDELAADPDDPDKVGSGITDAVLQTQAPQAVVACGGADRQ